MVYDSRRIYQRIEQALLAENYTEEKARDIAFHMTDWLKDLEELNNFFLNPDEYDLNKIEELLMGFLIHSPNHLSAAAKLLVGLEVTDVFDVGDGNK